jgi:predicted PurR-regulated permease PerM
MAQTWTVIGILGALVVVLVGFVLTKLDRIIESLNAFEVKSTSDIASLEVKFTNESASVRKDISALDVKFTNEFASVRKDISQVSTELGDLRGEMRGVSTRVEALERHPV